MNHRHGGQTQTVRLFATQHGVVSRAQVLAAGITPRMIDRRLQGGEWRRVHPGVYALTSAPTTWHHRVMAASLATSGLASHRSAARLWGLDLPGEDRVDVTIEGTARVSARGVRVHRTRAFEPADRATVEGIACTSVARTLLDLASVLPADELEAALDSALRERLTAVAYLERRLQTKGRRGGETLRRLLSDRTGERPSESRREAELCRLLVAAGLPRPVRQFELRHGNTLLARFDLAWPDAQIAVEFQSYRHHFGRQAWRRDVARANRVTAAGWIVLMATEDDVRDGVRALVANIRRAGAA